MIASEPQKMISWAYGTPPTPTASVMATKTRLPPSTAQLGRVFSTTSRSCLRKRCRITPSTEITGITSAAV